MTFNNRFESGKIECFLCGILFEGSEGKVDIFVSFRAGCDVAQRRRRGRERPRVSAMMEGEGKRRLHNGSLHDNRDATDFSPSDCEQYHQGGWGGGG